VPNSAGLALASVGLVGPAGATVLNNGSAICAGLNALRPLISSSWSKAEPLESTKANARGGTIDVEPVIMRVKGEDTSTP
ncbi:MAG: hypothetical protein K8F91_26345, partial [Candidatus Obscuribacterales bacterium]|nr:hypothetical protein [Candidatus Obscuribacterales bacterium]